MPPAKRTRRPAAMEARPLGESDALIDTAQIGLALVRDRRIVRVNTRGAAILGRPATAVAGLELRHVLPDFTSYSRLLEAARQQDAPEKRTAACALLRPDGSQVMVRLHIRRLGEDEGGETVAWSFEDMAEQETLRKELQASRQAIVAAQAAKTHFLANISHELRTPLNGILGMSQLLLDGNDLQEEAREFLGIIRQSAGVLVRILGDLLDMSKVETGQLVLEERAFDLRAECAPVFRNFTAQSQLRPFSFTYAIDPRIPARLYGDPARTKQILVNLLNNAFKYTHQGQVSLRMELWRSDAPAPPPDHIRLHIAIADTGIGIAPDRQDIIFEPFGIGEDYLTKKYSGVGLGLSIAKQLALMMGGDISLQSAPGQGSTFSVLLEFGLVQGDAPPVAAPLPAPGPVDRPLRILLAEDEPVNRIFTARALQKFGHTVDTATDGREALAMLARSPYDLVLMDIQMPHLNGLEATSRIRSGQEPNIAPNLPIVALSAYAMESDRTRGLEAGMDAYVTKPYDAVDLENAMRQVLSHRGNGKPPHDAGGCA